MLDKTTQFWKNENKRQNKNYLTMRKENEIIGTLTEEFENSKYSGWTQWNELVVAEKREFCRFFVLFFEKHLEGRPILECEKHGKQVSDFVGLCPFCERAEAVPLIEQKI